MSRMVALAPRLTLKVSFPEEMQGKQDEADTLLAFHASKSEGQLVIRSFATDVLIIIPGMMIKYHNEKAPLKHKKISWT